MKKTIYKASNVNIKRVVDILNVSGVIAFPTETVYGLGGDASSESSIKKIYLIKNRPLHNPLIIHVATLEQAKIIGKFNNTAMKMARVFWPGPLTLLVEKKRNNGITPAATSNLDSIAIRVPSNPIALKILNTFGKPIAAPSANLSGTVSSTNAQHVFSDFGDSIDLIIDNGDCEHGIESTIVDARSDKIKILREGSITKENIISCLNQIVGDYNEDKIIAPGQLDKHYAPKASLRLNIKEPKKDEFYISFGDNSHKSATLNLSKEANLVEAAQKLYSTLRKIDDMGIKKVAVAPIPNIGIGKAINDRLSRASK